MPQKVSEVMTCEPVALPLDATLTDAAKLMRDHGIGDVLVTSGGLLCGMVTDRDIVVRGVAESRAAALTRLGDVCSAEMVTLRPDDDTSIAVELMRRLAIRRLPVVAAGQPIGIVSIGDLAPDDGAVSALVDISNAPPNL